MKLGEMRLSSFIALLFDYHFTPPPLALSPFISVLWILYCPSVRPTPAKERLSDPTARNDAFSSHKRIVLAART
jgi:hypothetical protein